MANMERGVLAAIERLPHLGEAIRRLAFADPAFRSLCDDLAEAQEACARWAGQSSDQAAARHAEYEQLAAELADEISTAIRDRGHADSLGRTPPLL